MINLQLNHEQIINFSKNAARCTCPGTYGETAITAVVLGSTIENTPDGSGVIAELTFKILKQQRSTITAIMPTFFEETLVGPDAYVPEARSGELTSLVGDFCGPNFGPPDGYVDVWDLMCFAECWNCYVEDPCWENFGCSRYDLAGPNFGPPDGYIDVWDLMVFADHWHEGESP